MVKKFCYLFKAVSLPELISVTILEMSNCSRCARSLDEDSSSLKSVLTVLNWRGLPANKADYRQHVKMETRLATSFIEEQFGQRVEHSKPKTMESFIRGRKTNLEDFTTLLKNLRVACMCLVRLQLNSNHNPLIAWFAQLPEFKNWHVKHQTACP